MELSVAGPGARIKSYVCNFWNDPFASDLGVFGFLAMCFYEWYPTKSELFETRNLRACQQAQMEK